MIPVPEQVLDVIAASFGTDRDGLTYLGGGSESSDGIAYTFMCDGEARVLKILPTPVGESEALPRIQERLKFVHFLGQHGVDTVYPLPVKNGSLLVTRASGETTFVAYQMRKVLGGKADDPKGWNDSFYFNWGKTIGNLHRITQLYPSWQCSKLPDGTAVLGWEEELQGFYEMCGDPDVKALWLEMRRRLAKLPMQRDCFGFIHNDPHIQNMILASDRIVLLDFDVANYHWFAMDIMIALQGLLFFQTGGIERPVVDSTPLRHFLKVFMQGYETENHLDCFWLDQMDLFIQYRRMLLFTVMQGWIGSQPELHASWKKMIMEEPAVVGQGWRS